MTATRTETDTFGPIEVAADRYWGAQSQRSIGNFKIGWEKQPQPMICLLYTSPSPRDKRQSRMPSSA